MNWIGWRRVRIAVQVFALLLFIYLLFAALQRRVVFDLADLFFRLDPLAAFGSMVAARAWIPRIALALVTVALTIVVGRVWCGWICPLGTLLDVVRFPNAGRRAARLSPRWRLVRYVILLLIIALALFGNLTLMILDPITLFTRTMTTAVIPALNHAVTAIERALYSVEFLRPVIDRFEAVVRGPVLPVEQPVFHQNVLILLIFAGVLALSAFADRFWCRYLCPLGALLSMLSKISILRPFVGPACNRCGHCLNICPTDAIDVQSGYQIVVADCVVCLDCMSVCPETGAGFEPKLRPEAWGAYDPSRRQALAVFATGAVSAAVLGTGVRAKRPHALRVRPPGVDDEDDFLARCIRCSQCMKVCPTSGLQPALSEAGLGGVWTPVLVPRLGYCDYGCNACGQVCPSDAIPTLALAAKRQQVIGMAVVDRSRCWPWAYDIPCIVCEEMCPVPDKAITLEEVAVTNTQGEEIVLQRPYVVSDLCIGCGICEYQCPVQGEAAIKVFTPSV